MLLANRCPKALIVIIQQTCTLLACLDQLRLAVALFNSALRYLRHIPVEAHKRKWDVESPDAGETFDGDADLQKKVILTRVQLMCVRELLAAAVESTKGQIDKNTPPNSSSKRQKKGAGKPKSDIQQNYERVQSFIEKSFTETQIINFIFVDNDTNDDSSKIPSIFIFDALRLVYLLQLPKTAMPNVASFVETLFSKYTFGCHGDLFFTGGGGGGGETIDRICFQSSVLPVALQFGILNEKLDKTKIEIHKLAEAKCPFLGDANYRSLEDDWDFQNNTEVKGRARKKTKLNSEMKNKSKRVVEKEQKSKKLVVDSNDMSDESERLTLLANGIDLWNCVIENANLRNEVLFSNSENRNFLLDISHLYFSSLSSTISRPGFQDFLDVNLSSSAHNMFASAALAVDNFMLSPNFPFKIFDTMACNEGSLSTVTSSLRANLRNVRNVYCDYLTMATKSSLHMLHRLPNEKNGDTIKNCKRNCRQLSELFNLFSTATPLSGCESDTLPQLLSDIMSDSQPQPECTSTKLNSIVCALSSSCFATIVDLNLTMLECYASSLMFFSADPLDDEQVTQTALNCLCRIASMVCLCYWALLSSIFHKMVVIVTINSQKFRTNDIFVTINSQNFHKNDVFKNSINMILLLQSIHINSIKLMRPDKVCL